MRRRTFMGFVACCVALLPVGSSFVAAADGLRVSGPIVHDNLAIYFLHGSATGDAVPHDPGGGARQGARQGA